MEHSRSKMSLLTGQSLLNLSRCPSHLNWRKNYVYWKRYNFVSQTKRQLTPATKANHEAAKVKYKHLKKVWLLVTQCRWVIYFIKIRTRRLTEQSSCIQLQTEENHKKFKSSVSSIILTATSANPNALSGHVTILEWYYWSSGNVVTSLFGWT